MSESLVLLGIIIAGVERPARPSSGADVDERTVGDHAAGRAGSRAWPGGVATFWATGDSQPIVLPWSIPGAEFSVAIDGLSAIFLVPVFLISLLGNVYGLGYWKQTEHPQNGRKLRLFYGTLTAGMALLVIARNSILFLFGWEIMALSAFFLVTTEDDEKEVREAGWLYLVATHTRDPVPVRALRACFVPASGSFALAPLEPEPLTPGMATAIFVLALVGFRLQSRHHAAARLAAQRHAAAPSHVSAIMSGVLIKMGIYGLVRVTSLLADPPLGWGAIVLALGVVSGVLGVAFAIGQHDLKRLLAYHSIENIGIIVMGIGLAMIGRSLGRADLGHPRPGRQLAARLEPRPVQGPAVLECRLRHPRRPHPRDRPPGRPGEGDAVDFPLFSGRGGRHLRPAAA